MKSEEINSWCIDYPNKWKAEKHSSLTQNQALEIAWIVQICNTNVHTIGTCGQKFQIPKYSAPSEMHFKIILNN